MCFNRKVLGGLALVALGILAFAPGPFSRALPLLFLAACPLSMLLMTRRMSGQGQCSTRAEEAPVRRAAGQEAEIARLRAEVERLRAERLAAAQEPAALEVGLDAAPR